jgi:hypothetical protein
MSLASGNSLRRLAVVLVAAVAALLVAGPARADTFTVGR